MGALIGSPLMLYSSKVTVAFLGALAGSMLLAALLGAAGAALAARLLCGHLDEAISVTNLRTA